MDLMTGDYEQYIKNEINEKPLDLLEINKNYFGVLTETNILYIYDSQTAEIYSKIKIQKIQDNNFKTMTKVIEDGILFLFDKNLILFRLSSLQLSCIVNDNFTDACYINNSNNDFLTVFSNSNINGLFLINIDLVKCKINIIKRINNTNNAHSMRINCILHLNNGKIITGSEDKTIKIWDMQFNANEEL